VKPRRSLLHRTVLTVAAGLFVFQVVAGVAVSVYVLTPLAKRSADDLAAFLVLSARTYVELPVDTRPSLVAELAQHHHIELSEAPDAHEEVRHYPYMNLLRDALARRLESESAPRLTELADGRFHADFPMAGHLLHFTFAKDLVSPSPLKAVWWILAASLVVTFAIAWILARRVSAPVARLAEAARRIGAGEKPPRLPETGDRELADLARVLNETAAQLQAQRENQATLLAGVSHDLRSPLSRMQMTLGILAEENVSPALAKLEGYVAEMDSLIGAQLALSRARQREDARDTDIDALLAERAAAASALAPGEVRLRADGEICRAKVAPLPLQRIVDNLVENALAHGHAGYVDVVRRRCGGTLFVGVRDRGPGIPPELREAVFRPFFRAEPSRSRATGGSGLGLAIARQLAQTHGWRLALKPRHGGGTSAWLAIGLA
jgi:two-component system osmolarity sensor histidine kinase EnvZ